jgi:hypothetical protein
LARLLIHAVHLVEYMGEDPEGLKKMPEEFEVETKGISISTHVRWLVNPPTIREKRQYWEITVSLVVFVVKGSKVPQS